jgi:hypothetical protein
MVTFRVLYIPEEYSEDDGEIYSWSPHKAYQDPIVLAVLPLPPPTLDDSGSAIGGMFPLAKLREAVTEKSVVRGVEEKEHRHDYDSEASRVRTHRNEIFFGERCSGGGLIGVRLLKQWYSLDTRL